MSQVVCPGALEMTTLSRGSAMADKTLLAAKSAGCSSSYACKSVLPSEQTAGCAHQLMTGDFSSDNPAPFAM